MTFQWHFLGLQIHLNLYFLLTLFALAASKSDIHRREIHAKEFLSFKRSFVFKSAKIDIFDTVKIFSNAISDMENIIKR